MKVLASAGREDVAMVYVVDLGQDRLVECVEAVQPPIPREDKWVLLVSTLFGCPIGCMMCDAGGYYHGKPTKEEIFAQIDFLVQKRYPDKIIPSKQFKIQLARMGEPALNPAVLDVLEELPTRYNAPGLIPSLSTVAPKGCEKFLDRMLEIKNEKYAGGNFQFQFSLHTTDRELRDRIIPTKKWDFTEMAAYGERYYRPGDRRVTLNFALAKGNTIDPEVLLDHFNPEKFLIKITPLNPTYRAAENQLASHITNEEDSEGDTVIAALRQSGYRVIVSIGELEENLIGSNCGQFVRRHLQAGEPIQNGYTYSVQAFPGQ